MNSTQQINELRNIRDRIKEYLDSLNDVVTELRSGSIENQVFCAETADLAMDDIASEIITAKRILCEIKN